jgi:hypothetical protein
MISFGFSATADALALAARELVRVAVEVLGVEPDGVHQLLDRLAPLALAGLHPVDRERLADDRADRLARVQRRVRVLEDHLRVAAELDQLLRLDVGDLLALELDRAAGRIEQAQQQAAGGRLAAARLAHQAERLAALDVEGDAVDGVHGADLLAEDQPGGEREVLLEIADLVQRLAAAHVRGRA